MHDPRAVTITIKRTSASANLPDITKDVLSKRKKTGNATKAKRTKTSSKKQKKQASPSSKKDINAAATLIQKFFRRQRRGCCNQEDLELQLLKGPLFHHIVTSSQVYRFKPSQLYKYFLASGKFENPYTRQDFNATELNRLSRVMHQETGNYIDIASNMSKIQEHARVEQEYTQRLQIASDEVDQIHETFLAMLQAYGSWENPINTMMLTCQAMATMAEFAHAYRVLYDLNAGAALALWEKHLKSGYYHCTLSHLNGPGNRHKTLAVTMYVNMVGYISRLVNPPL